MLRRQGIWTAVLFAGFLTSQNSLAGAVDPLFDSDALLAIRIEAPLSTIKKERSEENELAAILQLTSDADAGDPIAIQVRARGKFRRRKSTCRFPPLRLNFKTSQVSGTVFENQDKLKLVTHCRDGQRYGQAVIREYLTYRILNIMTDSSFRVRLLQITYVDTDEENSQIERYGFAVEHTDGLARRLDKAQHKVSKTEYDRLDPAYANLVSVFHYLVGNTDFSPIAGPADDDCCHNHVLFGDAQTALVSVPYDFDQSGMVDAAYAAPNPRFKLRNAKHRLYRGRCVNNEILTPTIAAFNEKRLAIESLIQSTEQLSKSSTKDMLEYVEKFYAVMNSEKRVQRELVKKCL